MEEGTKRDKRIESDDEGHSRQPKKRKKSSSFSKATIERNPFYVVLSGIDGFCQIAAQNVPDAMERAEPKSRSRSRFIAVVTSQTLSIVDLEVC